MAELHKTSRAFLGAYRKGRQAAIENKPRGECPYADLRGGQYGQITTWSRSFQNYWWDGFDDEKAGKPVLYTA